MEYLSSVCTLTTSLRPTSRVSVSLGKHELYSVDLVCLGSSRVEIYRNDVALRVLSAEALR